MAIEPAVIDIWQSSVSEAQTFSVVPDGCRDVILTTTEQGACSVHVSPLYANTLNVQMTPGMTMLGYRLAPGAFIDESRLICALTESSQDIEDKVGVYTHICPDISEILESIRHHQGRASLLAVKLGVSERTLQRHLTRHTGISPVFWMQLTRVRQSAKSIRKWMPIGGCCLRLGDIPIKRT
ncbi:AraC family transcriptional regulator [Enterovibrio nigricans]|nr:helix-turn-helix domain-containing protein [Enterovibrio nigricans]PKF49293.1 AraC family transcriptional regulator [Enterovibrio nigricans]